MVSCSFVGKMHRFLKLQIYSIRMRMACRNEMTTMWSNGREFTFDNPTCDMFETICFNLLHISSTLSYHNQTFFDPSEVAVVELSSLLYCIELLKKYNVFFILTLLEFTYRNED